MEVEEVMVLDKKAVTIEEEIVKVRKRLLRSKVMPNSRMR